MSDATPPAPPLTIRLTDDAGRLRPLIEIEDEVMRLAVELCGGNVTKALPLIGVSKSTYYRHLRERADAVA